MLRMSRRRLPPIHALALNILKSYGTNAHLYLPGIGVINDITAGNWQDSSGTIPAAVDSPVGLIKNANGLIDASQATAGSRPVLRRGLVNQLKQSTSLSGWAALNTPTVAGGVTAPDGSTSATSVTFSANALCSVYSPTVPATISNAVTVAAWVKSAAAKKFKFRSFGSTQYTSADFVTTAAWQLFVWNLPDAAAAANFGVENESGGGIGQIDVWSVGLFQGTLTAQQILQAGGIPLTTTVAASSTYGDYSNQFDGVDDYLSLGSVPFQMADDHCVVAGAKYTGGAAGNCVVASPSQGVGALTRAGQISYDSVLNSISASWYDGTNYDNLQFSYPTNTGFVATAAKRSSSSVLRVNGVQRSATTPTASFASTQGTIGAYAGGTSGWFNGHIYPVIAIKGTVSDADLMILEKFVGSLSGVTI